MNDDAYFAAPIDLLRESVREEWLDYNGHMNVAYYVLVLDRATDIFMDAIGIDADYRARKMGSLFALEQHVVYRDEVRLGDPLRVTTQLVDHDDKRVHYFHRMYHGEQGYLAATGEFLSIHVDLAARRTRPFPPAIIARIERMAAAHATLGTPAEVGRSVAIRRKR